ncbi:MAG: UDP-N-acetylglucosamine--N-acetylmuramyl-(pentapeptide) pyrophosphoryl-undecaprenol N-acetylglucosamine transferase [Planctomycetota bacterium]|nr:UDP-N-acetylglucosamine--N-acetylmuramyl-(pentapeptide) pyrophosphoryl-undecaprenol N-acetylglucosamine transferase [Planctomycetota bacterium]
MAHGSESGSNVARTFLFAGGGSGGHLSPALAIAERIGELEPSARSLFVCSRREIDATMLSEAKVCFEPIAASPFSVRPRPLLRFVANYRRSIHTVKALIQRERVDRLVALGGFVSAPVVVAAAKCHVPVTLINLDDPPGKANRWIARRCEQVFSAIDVGQLPRFAQRVVGMPIRRCALAPHDSKWCRNELGLDPARLTLLVTGASQGSRSINALLIALAASDPSMFADWQVCHLCGRADSDAVRRAYAAASIPAVVVSFVHHIGLAWGAADLAISRAGASSVAEAWANSVPTIFVPYPHHRDQHQQRNAQPMVAVGGAVIEPDHLDPTINAHHIGTTLRALLSDHDRRRTMQVNLRAHPPADAAVTIARLLLDLPDDQPGSPADAHALTGQGAIPTAAG